MYLLVSTTLIFCVSALQFPLLFLLFNYARVLIKHLWPKLVDGEHGFRFCCILCAAISFATYSPTWFVMSTPGLQTQQFRFQEVDTNIPILHRCLRPKGLLAGLAMLRMAQSATN
jgi:hypothetical protein